MRRHPIVVAFVEVESDDHRHLRYAMTPEEKFDVGLVIRDARSRPVLLRDSGNFPEGVDPAPCYWCAADKPPTGRDFVVRPVYRTTKVADGARCETCGIGIRELQEMLGKVTFDLREGP